MGVTRLVHLESMRRSNTVTMPGPFRPDLIGQNANSEWMIVEAKGRTQGFSQQAQDKAKQQSLNITAINGVPPVAHTACQTYFGKHMRVRFEDPEPQSEQINVHLDRRSYLEEYYAPFMQAPELKRMRFFDGQFMGLSLKDVGVTIGVNERLYKAMTNGNIVEESYISQEISSDRDILDQTVNTRLFNDGFVISLDEDIWSMKTMRREPKQRLGL